MDNRDKSYPGNDRQAGKCNKNVALKVLKKVSEQLVTASFSLL